LNRRDCAWERYTRNDLTGPCRAGSGWRVGTRLCYLSTSRIDGRMMADILEYQASDAKAKWAELLDEVERGRSVRITRHGKTIARVVPEADVRAVEVADAIARLRALREKTVKAPLAEILASRHEGHRY
jgi:prevent-host-death family protein